MQWYVVKGVLERKSGKDELAFDSVKKALQIQPDLEVANHFVKLFEPLGLEQLILKASEQLESGESEKGLQTLDKILQMDPNSVQGHEMKKDVLIKLDRLSETLESCQKLVELKQDQKSFYDFASCLISLDRFDQALGKSNLAIKLDPVFFPAYILKETILRWLGRCDEAISVCDKMSEIDPNFAVAYEHKAAALYFQRKYSEAIEASKKATSLKPDLYQSYYHRAMSLTNMNAPKAGLRCISEGLLHSPNNALLLCGEGEIYSELREYEKTVEVWETTLKIAERRSGTLKTDEKRKQLNL
jgi:tetratricopeptide (TPR) repeat protein